MLPKRYNLKGIYKAPYVRFLRPNSPQMAEGEKRRARACMSVSNYLLVIVVSSDSVSSVQCILNIPICAQANSDFWDFVLECPSELLFGKPFEQFLSVQYQNTSYYRKVLVCSNRLHHHHTTQMSRNIFLFTTQFIFDFQYLISYTHFLTFSKIIYQLRELLQMCLATFQYIFDACTYMMLCGY